MSVGPWAGLLGERSATMPAASSSGSSWARLPLIAARWVTNMCAELAFVASRRRHTRCDCDWSSDVCSSDLRRRLGRLTRAAPGGPEHEARDDERRPNETERPKGRFDPRVEQHPDDAGGNRGEDQEPRVAHVLTPPAEDAQRELHQAPAVDHQPCA